MKPITILMSLILNVFISFYQIKITVAPDKNTIPIITASSVSYIVKDSTDEWLVQKSATLLQQDIEIVIGKKVQIIHSIDTETGEVTETYFSVNFRKRVKDEWKDITLKGNTTRLQFWQIGISIITI